MDYINGYNIGKSELDPRFGSTTNMRTRNVTDDIRVTLSNITSHHPCYLGHIYKRVKQSISIPMKLDILVHHLYVSFKRN